jgi:hypothetical protein
MTGRRHTTLLSWQSLRRLWRAAVASDKNLTADEAASTLFRFFRSKHVVDLKALATLAVLILIGHACLVYFHYHADFPKYLAPAVPVYGAVIAWAYLTASTRLGVVDLFACEIGTLCRVGTAFDIGRLYIGKHEDGVKEIRSGEAAEHAAAEHVAEKHAAREHAAAKSLPSGFSSQEDYFPVFASNSHDLEALEALVVGDITQFYTYMKAARDLQRRLGGIGSGSEEAQTALENLIYVLFLGYESGRKAIEDLIEFEPTRAENIIVILITELVCFAFLCVHFTDSGDDLRFTRLRIRKTAYTEFVPGLINAVNGPHKKGTEKDWSPAQYTVSELINRYNAAIETLARCEKHWKNIAKQRAD